jgi:hypothetical protein
MSQLHPTEEDEQFAQGHLEAGFKMRVAWVKKLRAKLEELKEKYPQESGSIQEVLDSTKEWL